MLLFLLCIGIYYWYLLPYQEIPYNFHDLFSLFYV